MTDTPTASPEAREVARDIAHVATPSCSNRPVAYRAKTPHSRACNRLAATIARALDAYAAPLREEIEARRADCVIKVANARREALEEAADEAFQWGDGTMAAKAIRALAQEDGNG